MIQILVKLEVKSWEFLHQFETSAVKIMQKHQGKILAAFEIEESTVGTPQEIHLLEFPSSAHFSNYRNDSELKKFSDLRDNAILNTEVSVSTKLKSY